MKKLLPWVALALAALIGGILAIGFATSIDPFRWMRPSPSKPAAEELALIRQRADPREVQRWAVEQLRQQPGGTNTAWSGSNAPAFLRDLAILDRHGPFVTVHTQDDPGHVVLLYAESLGFGGSGHVVEVGDEHFTMATNARCLEWIPGVYFRKVSSP